jgi:hypothetical protein
METDKADLPFIVRELRLLTAIFRPGGNAGYIEAVAHEISRLKPTRLRLIVAMHELRARHDSLPSLSAVTRAVRRATGEVEEEGATP